MFVKDVDALFARVMSSVKRETLDEFTEVCYEGLEVCSYVSRGTGCKARSSAHRIFAIHRLYSGLAKKFVGSDSTIRSEIEDKTIDDFLAQNEACKHFNRNQGFDALPDSVKFVLAEVRVLLHSVLESNGDQSRLSLSSLASHLRAGPGASSGAKSDLFGSYGRFCCGPVGYTNKLVYSMFKTMASSTKLGFYVERTRRALYGERDDKQYVNLTVVTKTAEKGRTIATQPVCNMTIELALHQVICNILVRFFGINLENQQEKNKDLARLGSLSNSIRGSALDWDFVTVDLKAASDYPYVLIKWLFPVKWVRFLFVLRSPFVWVQKSTEKKARLIRKHVFSTMGNGFTFAVMTLLFSSIVKVLYSINGLPESDILSGERRQTWAVFGDDIIVDRRVYAQLLEVLTFCGIKVNLEKTFTSGPFRESCGGDYYLGRSVRPVYLEKLDTLYDLYSLYNRLNDWSYEFGCKLPTTLSILLGEIRLLENEMEKGKREKRVPNTEQVVSGLRVPYHLAYQQPPKKQRCDMGDHIGVLPLDKVSLDGVQYECWVPKTKKSMVFEVKYSSRKATILPPGYLHFMQTSRIRTQAEYYRRGYNSIKPVELRTPYQENISFVTENIPGALLYTISGEIDHGIIGQPKPSWAVTRYRQTWAYTPSWGSAYVDDWSGAIYGSLRPNVYRHWEWWTSLMFQRSTLLLR